MNILILFVHVHLYAFTTQGAYTSDKLHFSNYQACEVFLAEKRATLIKEFELKHPEKGLQNLRCRRTNDDGTPSSR